MDLATPVPQQINMIFYKAPASNFTQGNNTRRILRLEGGRYATSPSFALLRDVINLLRPAIKNVVVILIKRLLTSIIQPQARDHKSATHVDLAQTTGNTSA